MSRYVENECDEQDFLSSISGWGQFIRWAEMLDVKNFSQIRDLAESGWCQNLDDLRAQLNLATKVNAPIPDIAPIIDVLVEWCGKGKLLMITDGMGSDDGTNEDENREDDDVEN